MNLPKEFIDKMRKLLGSEAEEFFSSLENPSQKGITLNTSRMSKAYFSLLTRARRSFLLTASTTCISQS